VLLTVGFSFNERLKNKFKIIAVKLPVTIPSPKRFGPFQDFCSMAFPPLFL